LARARAGEEFVSTRAAVIATIAVLVGTFVVGIGAVLLMPGPRSPERAEKLGQGMGSLLFLVLAVIWLFWAQRRFGKRG
jgi:hypothetical protein